MDKLINFLTTKLPLLKKNPSAQEILLHKKVLLCQYSFYKSLGYLRTFSGDDLTSIIKISTYMEHLSLENPLLYTQAFQETLDFIVGSRCTYMIKDLINFSNNAFNVQDPFGICKDVCKGTDFWTAISLKIMCENLGIKSSDVFLNITPLNIPETIPYLMELKKRNLTYTDNAAPDISLYNKPYDFKNAKVSFGKNHIFFLETNKYNNALLSSLENIIRSQHQTASDQMVRLYAQKLLLDIEQGKSTSKTVLEIVNKCNSNVKQSVPPEGFKMPIIIEKKNPTEEVIDREIKMLEDNPNTLSDLNSIPVKIVNCKQIMAKTAVMATIHRAVPQTRSHILQKYDHIKQLYDKENHSKTSINDDLSE